MISTSLTSRFGIEHPILSAPMDTVSGGELAAAVSASGGLGLIGGGYGDADWLRREFRTAHGHRVGCGFITWALHEQPELLPLVLEYRPTCVLLSFGDPTTFIPRIREAEAFVVCQVNDQEEADRCLDAGVDALVAQGGEAGGHSRAAQSTMTLVPEVATLVQRRESDALVLAAGGIADGRGLAAALTLGADGVLVGTRFYTASEARSTPAARERALAATGSQPQRTTVYDAVRRPWPRGYNSNVLRNDFVARWHGREAELDANLAAATTEFQQALREEDYDLAHVTVGQAVGIIEQVRPAAEIVTSMVDEATRATQRIELS